MSLSFSFCQFCNLAKCWLRPFSESTFHHKKSILNTRNYIPPFNIQNMWIRWLEADHFSCNMFLVIDLAVHITQSDQGFWFRMVHNLFPVPLTFLTFLWLLICYPLPILLNCAKENTVREMQAMQLLWKIHLRTHTVVPSMPKL